MRKQVQPVLLPQGKKGWNKDEIISSPDGGYDIALFASDTELGDIKAQYIYITDYGAQRSDGDYVYSEFTEPPISMFNQNTHAIVAPSCKKIIATNNPQIIALGISSITDEFIRQYVDCNGDCVVFAEMIDITPALLDEKPIWEYRTKNDALVLTMEKQIIDIRQSIADRIQDKQPSTYTEEDMIGFAEWLTHSAQPKSISKQWWILNADRKEYMTKELLDIYKQSKS